MASPGSAPSAHGTCAWTFTTTKMGSGELSWYVSLNENPFASLNWCVGLGAGVKIPPPVEMNTPMSVLVFDPSETAVAVYDTSPVHETLATTSARCAHAGAAITATPIAPPRVTTARRRVRRPMRDPFPLILDDIDFRPPARRGQT